MGVSGTEFVCLAVSEMVKQGEQFVLEVTMGVLGHLGLGGLED